MLWIHGGIESTPDDSEHVHEEEDEHNDGTDGTNRL